MNLAALSNLSRDEKISATVLEILAAVAPREMREDTFFNLARLGLVPDMTRAELKGELVACESAGWAECDLRKGFSYWYGTRAAVASGARCRGSAKRRRFQPVSRARTAVASARRGHPRGQVTCPDPWSRTTTTKGPVRSRGNPARCWAPLEPQGSGFRRARLRWDPRPPRLPSCAPRGASVRTLPPSRRPSAGSGGSPDPFRNGSPRPCDSSSSSFSAAD